MQLNAIALNNVIVCCNTQKALAFREMESTRQTQMGQMGEAGESFVGPIFNLSVLTNSARLDARP